jgi:hypothetical protein
VEPDHPEWRPDDLIERLRARAADPDRRTDERGSGLGAFASRLRLWRTRGARLPASAESLRAAEAALGRALPPFLARVYLEVADGGFGPGEGLLPLAGVVTHAERLRSGGLLPRKRTWPTSLLPLVRLEQGWTCVDAHTGAIVDWDPEDLTEWAGAARFRESFRDRSPSVEAWLGRWVSRRTAADRNKPSAKEREARMLARAGSPGQRAIQGRKAVAMLVDRPAERATLGLPDEGWEEVVLGWYVDQSNEPG